MNDEQPLQRRLLAVFALPAIMVGFMHAPEAIVQGIYAKHAGISLSVLALAMVITRAFDGITYPLIGYLSDRTARQYGRKPWLLAGTAVTVTGLWLLYRPPTNVGVAYFTGWFMVTYLGWKMTEIPYAAWSFNLSHEYRNRARIQTWRALGQMLGIVAFYLVPYAAASAGLSKSAELDFDSLGLVAWMILLLVPALNLLTVWTVREAEAVERSVAPRRESWQEIWRVIVGNAPLLRFVAAFVLMTVLIGMATGTAYLFVDVYLGLGKQLAGILLLATLVQIVSVPVWGALSQRFERHRVLALGWVVAAVLYAAIGFLPQGPQSMAAFATLYTLGGLGLGAFYVIAPAIVGDISDHGRVLFGHDHAGLYSAIFSFITKSVGGLAVGLGLAVVGWFGFDATSSGAQSISGALGIKLVAAWLPGLGLASASLLLWNFPLNRQRIQGNAVALTGFSATPSAPDTLTLDQRA